MTRLLLLLALTVPLAAQTTDRTSAAAPVKSIAPARIHVDKGAATATLPLYVSADWSRPQPAITRALLVFHGKLRNADYHNLSGQPPSKPPTPKQLPSCSPRSSSPRVLLSTDSGTVHSSFRPSACSPPQRLDQTSCGDTTTHHQMCCARTAIMS